MNSTQKRIIARWLKEGLIVKDSAISRAMAETAESEMIREMVNPPTYEISWKAIGIFVILCVFIIGLLIYCLL